MGTPDMSEFEPAPRLCSVARALERLSEEDRAKFEIALATPRYSNAKIVERMRAREITVHKGTVAAHRKRECICVR